MAPCPRSSCHYHHLLVLSRSKMHKQAAPFWLQTFTLTHSFALCLINSFQATVWRMERLGEWVPDHFLARALPSYTHTDPNQQNHEAELSHHFFATSIYCPQDSGNFTEEKWLFPLPALQLHLNTLLEGVSPGAFIIERSATAILWHDNGICCQI